MIPLIPVHLLYRYFDKKGKSITNLWTNVKKCLFYKLLFNHTYAFYAISSYKIKYWPESNAICSFADPIVIDLNTKIS